MYLKTILRMDHFSLRNPIKLTFRTNLCLAKEPTMPNFNSKREFKTMLQFLTKTSHMKAISFLGVIDANSKFFHLFFYFY
jgi:hypothetical protein